MQFTYDPETRTYRDEDGKIITREELRHWVLVAVMSAHLFLRQRTESYVWTEIVSQLDRATLTDSQREDLQGQLDQITADAKEDDTDLEKTTRQDWYADSLEEITSLYTAMTILAAGGAERIDDKLTAQLADVIKTQEGYLQNFEAQLASGQVLPTPAIVPRAASYANAGYGVYMNAERTVEIQAGDYNQEIRRDEDDQSECQQCELFANTWAAIGTLPEIGNLQCGSNCRCKFDYRQSDEPVTDVSALTQALTNTSYTSF